MLGESLVEKDADVEAAPDSLARVLAENEPVTELEALGECEDERDAAGVGETDAQKLDEMLTVLVGLDLVEKDIV